MVVDWFIRVPEERVAVEAPVAVERVAVSSVWEEVLEFEGEMVFLPRPIWLIDGVVKERGSVDVGRLEG